MGIRAFQVVHGRLYSIRKGLTLTRKKEVALRIFMEVSLGFEAMQGSWPYSWVTDSGFSAEDLTSNLIGFYRAVEKYSWEQILLDVPFGATAPAATPNAASSSPAGACPRRRSVDGHRGGRVVPVGGRRADASATD